MKTKKAQWVLGHKVTAFEPTGNYDLMVGETPAKTQGPPPHLHHHYNESFLMIEGEMEFFIDGEVKAVKAGQFIDIPPKCLHTFSNKSEAPCKWVNIHSPKGFLSFFEKLGIPAEEENAQERSVAPEIISEVIATAADYDMLIRI